MGGKLVFEENGVEPPLVMKQSAERIFANEVQGYPPVGVRVRAQKEVKKMEQKESIWKKSWQTQRGYYNAV
jgi:hypothetical protein